MDYEKNWYYQELVIGLASLVAAIAATVHEGLTFHTGMFWFLGLGWTYIAVKDLYEYRKKQERDGARLAEDYRGMNGSEIIAKVREKRSVITGEEHG